MSASSLDTPQKNTSPIDEKYDALTAAPPLRSPFSVLWGKSIGHNGMIIGGTIILAIILMAIFAPILAPHDPYTQDIAHRLTPPIWHDKGTWDHILGTDKLGRDYLSRIIFGSQISIFIGITSTALAAFIGCSLGVSAGYFGGRVDSIVSYIITTRLSMPVLLVALAVASLVGGSLATVTLVLGLLIWDRFAVVCRTATQQVCNAEYIQAAKAIGCSTWRIVFSEIMPNILNALIVVATLEIARAVILEATLSFLGLGVPAPEPSWGLMVAEGKQYMFFKPWIIIIPGVALLLMVMAVNLLGDGIRDVTAPENRN